MTFQDKLRRLWPRKRKQALQRPAAVEDLSPSHPITDLLATLSQDFDEMDIFPGHMGPIPARKRAAKSIVPPQAVDSGSHGQAQAASIVAGLDRPEERALLGDVLLLYNSTLEQHKEVCKIVESRFDEAMVWDTVTVATKGPKRMLSLMMAAKGLLQLNFLPESIEIAPHGVGGTGLATLRGQLVIRPRHSLLGMPLVLLTGDGAARFLMSLEVLYWVHNGMVHRVRERLHNLPSLPSVIRWLTGTVVGALTASTMQWWLPPYAQGVGKEPSDGTNPHLPLAPAVASM